MQRRARGCRKGWGTEGLVLSRGLPDLDSRQPRAQSHAGHSPRSGLGPSLFHMPASAPAVIPTASARAHSQPLLPTAQAPARPEPLYSLPSIFAALSAREPSPEAMAPSPGELPMQVLCPKPAGAPTLLSQS